MRCIGIGCTCISVSTYSYFLWNKSNIVLCEENITNNNFSKNDSNNTHQTLWQQQMDDIGNIVISMVAPFAITGISSIFLYRQWQSRRFLNVMNITLNCVQKSKETNYIFRNQYTLYSRTIKESEVRNVILHDKGSKVLCRAASKCIQNDQFIRMKGSAHRNVCNFIANQITTICAPDFIKRDILNHNKNAIRSQMYIFGLMAHCNRNKDILRLRKIFVLLLKEQSILELLQQFPNIEILTDDEGEKHLKGFQDTNFEHRNRWNMIKQIIIEYKRQKKDKMGGIEWAEPLCDLELTTSIDISLANDHEQDYYVQNPWRQPFNAWRKLIRRGPRKYTVEIDTDDTEYEQEEFVGKYRDYKQKEKKIMIEVLKDQAI